MSTDPRNTATITIDALQNELTRYRDLVARLYCALEIARVPHSITCPGELECWCGAVVHNKRIDQQLADSEPLLSPSSAQHLLALAIAQALATVNRQPDLKTYCELWQNVQQTSRDNFDENLNTLRELSHLAGGWFYPSAAADAQFMPLAEWERTFNDYMTWLSWRQPRPKAPAWFPVWREPAWSVNL